MFRLLIHEVSGNQVCWLSQKTLIALANGTGCIESDCQRRRQMKIAAEMGKNCFEMSQMKNRLKN